MVTQNGFNIGELIKIAQPLKEIVCHFKLGDEAKNIIVDTLLVPKALELLINNSLFTDAVNVLAHGLPKREAIWWAYRCAFQIEGESSVDAVTQALTLIKEWIFKPSEITRRMIEPLPESLEFKYSSAWAALAVFWSGGSIAPAGGPEVMPQEYLYAKAVAGSVMLASVLVSPEKSKQNYQKFLIQGIDISNGGNGEV